MNVSVLIPAVNNRRTIANVIHSVSLAAKRESYQITHLNVYVDEDTETEDIAAKAIEAHWPEYVYCSIVYQPVRQGKCRAIERWIRNSWGQDIDVYLLVNADIHFDIYTIPRLMQHMINRNVGIVGPRIQVLPTTSPTYLHRLQEFQWYVHDYMARRNPKCGEMVAFRLPETAASYVTHAGKIIPLIIPRWVSVDEAYLEHKFGRVVNRKVVYADEALVYTQPAPTWKQWIQRRRHVHCGHLQLRKRLGYKVASIDRNARRGLIDDLASGDFRHTSPVIPALLEGFCRLLGWWDYLRGRDYSVWPSASQVPEE